MALKSTPRRVLTSESELVALVRKRIQDVAQDQIKSSHEIGVGDDAAVVSLHAKSIVLTTDAMVDGVHFRRDQMSWHDLGWKSVVANQSDIAAMGAKPSHALLSLMIPDNVSYDDIDELMTGVTSALSKFGGRLVGGDTTSSPVLSVSVAMTGEGVTPSSALRRDAAMPGDLVAVTGCLGGSAGGLRILNDEAPADSQRENEDANELTRLHFTPTPRTDLAEAIVSCGVKCAMDISDGLLIDLGRICDASGVDAVIHADRIPVPHSLRRIFPEDAAWMALSGGEDYELLYAASSTSVADVNSAQLDATDAKFGIIGRFVEPEGDQAGNVKVLDENGEAMNLDFRGWDHFAGKGRDS